MGAGYSTSRGNSRASSPSRLPDDDGCIGRRGANQLSGEPGLPRPLSATAVSSAANADRDGFPRLAPRNMYRRRNMLHRTQHSGSTLEDDNLRDLAHAAAAEVCINPSAPTPRRTRPRSRVPLGPERTAVATLWTEEVARSTLEPVNQVGAEPEASVGSVAPPQPQPQAPQNGQLLSGPPSRRTASDCVSVIHEETPTKHTSSEGAFLRSSTALPAPRESKTSAKSLEKFRKSATDVSQGSSLRSSSVESKVTEGSKIKSVEVERSGGGGENVRLYEDSVQLISPAENGFYFGTSARNDSIPTDWFEAIQAMQIASLDPSPRQNDSRKRESDTKIVTEIVPAIGPVTGTNSSLAQSETWSGRGSADTATSEAEGAGDDGLVGCELNLKSVAAGLLEPLEPLEPTTPSDTSNKITKNGLVKGSSLPTAPKSTLYSDKPNNTNTENYKKDIKSTKVAKPKMRRGSMDRKEDGSEIRGQAAVNLSAAPIIHRENVGDKNFRFNLALEYGMGSKTWKRFLAPERPSEKEKDKEKDKQKATEKENLQNNPVKLKSEVEVEKGNSELNNAPQKEISSHDISTQSEDLMVSNKEIEVSARSKYNINERINAWKHHAWNFSKKALTVRKRNDLTANRNDCSEDFRDKEKDDPVDQVPQQQCGSGYKDDDVPQQSYNTPLIREDDQLHRQNSEVLAPEPGTTPDPEPQPLQVPQAEVEANPVGVPSTIPDLLIHKTEEESEKPADIQDTLKENSQKRFIDKVKKNSDMSSVPGGQSRINGTGMKPKGKTQSYRGVLGSTPVTRNKFLTGSFLRALARTTAERSTYSSSRVINRQTYGRLHSVYKAPERYPGSSFKWKSGSKSLCTTTVPRAYPFPTGRDTRKTKKTSQNSLSKTNSGPKENKKLVGEPKNGSGRGIDSNSQIATTKKNSLTKKISSPSKLVTTAKQFQRDNLRRSQSKLSREPSKSSSAIEVPVSKTLSLKSNYSPNAEMNCDVSLPTKQLPVGFCRDLISTTNTPRSNDHYHIDKEISSTNKEKSPLRARAPLNRIDIYEHRRRILRRLKPVTLENCRVQIPSETLHQVKITKVAKNDSVSSQSLVSNKESKLGSSNREIKPPTQNLSKEQCALSSHAKTKPSADMSMWYRPTIRTPRISAIGVRPRMAPGHEGCLGDDFPLDGASKVKVQRINKAPIKINRPSICSDQRLYTRMTKRRAPTKSSASHSPLISRNKSIPTANAHSANEIGEMIIDTFSEADSQEGSCARSDLVSLYKAPTIISIPSIDDPSGNALFAPQQVIVDLQSQTNYSVGQTDYSMALTDTNILSPINISEQTFVDSINDTLRTVVDTNNERNRQQTVSLNSREFATLDSNTRNPKQLPEIQISPPEEAGSISNDQSQRPSRTSSMKKQTEDLTEEHANTCILCAPVDEGSQSTISSMQTSLIVRAHSSKPIVSRGSTVVSCARIETALKMGTTSSGLVSHQCQLPTSETTTDVEIQANGSSSEGDLLVDELYKSKKAEDQSRNPEVKHLSSSLSRQSSAHAIFINRCQSSSQWDTDISSLECMADSYDQDSVSEVHLCSSDSETSHRVGLLLREPPMLERFNKHWPLLTMHERQLIKSEPWTEKCVGGENNSFESNLKEECQQGSAQQLRARFIRNGIAPSEPNPGKEGEHFRVYNRSLVHADPTMNGKSSEMRGLDGGNSCRISMNNKDLSDLPRKSSSDMLWPGALWRFTDDGEHPPFNLSDNSLHSRTNEVLSEADYIVDRVAQYIDVFALSAKENKSRFRHQ